MRLEAALAYNRGVAFLEKKAYDKAIGFFKKSIALFPSKEAYLNIATCYRGVDKDTQCYTHLLLANSPTVPMLDGYFLDTDYTLALSNLGLYFYSVGDDDTAISYYRRALAIDPNYYSCAWNLSCALLRVACSGHPEFFEEGWTLYQERFRKTPAIKIQLPNPNVKLWDGSVVDSILVYAEQGYGDNLMFARYIPLLKNFCKNIYVQCNDDIAPLFACLDVTTVLDGRDAPATHAIFMPSLAHIFPMMPGEWITGFSREPMADINIGIVFSGNSNHANDHNRSVNPHRFHPLAKYANLWCLTPGFRGTKHIKSLGTSDWTSTAQACINMDLVICVDTSVAHLCGSLGVECWLLQPLKDTDFRWGNGNSSHNAWYNSVVVYRNPNSWDEVFKQVITDVKDRFYG